MSETDKALANINTSLTNIIESQKNQATKDDMADLKTSIIEALGELPTADDFKAAFKTDDPQ